MAISETQIGNIALIRIGIDPVLNFAEDSEPARLLNRIFAQYRDEEIATGYYGFSKHRTTLAPSTTTPDWGFENFFPLPPDFLKLLEVDLDGNKYQDEDTGIAADTDALRIRYIKQVTNVSLWSRWLENVVSARLAFELVITLRNDLDLRVELKQEWRDHTILAKHAAAIQSSAPEVRADTWTNARLDGGGTVFGANGRPI